jgi:Rrf2 family protein
MFLSKTTTYAIRILIFMATDQQPLFSAQYLYEKLNISNRYLRRLLTDLSKHGFITSSRGRNGGFVFARSLETIYISEIIEAVEGTHFLGSCIMGFTDCKLSPVCAMHNPWLEIRNNMNHTFSKTSLQDIKNSG